MANISHFTQTVNGVSTTYDIHDANAVDLTSNQTVDGIKTFSNAPVVGSINLDGKTIDTDANGNMTYDGHKVLTSADLLPIGSYIQFAGSQAPDGFLVCNGGAISRTTYSALFAVIGTTYGSGDGSTTFNLPNLTDRFLQGSTTSGTVKNAGLPNITGSCTPASQKNSHTFNGWGAFKDASGSDAFQPESYVASGNFNLHFDASISNSIYGNSDTVQPPALTCLICIKY
jgi:microcystin-dependent protein